MQSKPLVTLITVSYNSDKTIGRTIESILDQTYNNIEYIVIDNLSTDKTNDIILSYQPKFEKRNFKYKLISEKDNGLYYAMNKGIDMASGNIIGIINSDDWYNNKAVEYIVDTFLKYNSDIVYGNIRTIINFQNKLYYKAEKSSKDLSNLKNDMVIKHPSVFVKKSVYSKLGSFNTEFKIAADWEFMSRCYYKGLEFKYINKEIAYFLYGGMSCKYSYNQLFESFKIRFDNGKKIYALIKLIGAYSMHLIKLTLELSLPSKVYENIITLNLKKKLKTFINKEIIL